MAATAPPTTAPRRITDDVAKIWGYLLAPPRTRSRRQGALLGAVIAAIGAAIRILCTGWLNGEYSFLLAYPAVTLAAALAGDTGGLVATFLGAALPIVMGWIDPDTALGATALGIYLATGILITALLHHLQLVQARLDAEHSTVESAKNEFLARVSHELRTPLNVAMGRVAMVLQSPDAPVEHRKKMLDAALRNLRSTQALVEDLIQVSKVAAAPQLDLVLLPLDLHPLLKSLIEDNMVYARSRGVQIDLRCEGTKAWVRGDEERLRQVFGNLLHNAVKFTVPPGTVHVRVSRQLKTHAVSVVDGGIGISPDDLPHIFDPFRQGGPAHHRDGSGLGLGLAIVKQLTEAHGGTVKALSSGRGKGAVFTVSLPVVEVPMQATG